MGFAEVYDIPVILAADIERGGVFASLYGTVRLLPPKWRRLVKGFIINKFRGDASILEPGIKQIENKLKIPCLGVVPHIQNLHIEAEDSLNFKSPGINAEIKSTRKSAEQKINIGIVRLGHISNFNEFDPLFFDERLAVRFFEYVPTKTGEFDMVIIPGSKSTVADLTAVKKSGIFDYIRRFSKRGIVMGICGGFQMMGERITDPHNLEPSASAGHDSGCGIRGFGFFKTETELHKEKILVNQKYKLKINGESSEHFLRGYEIHNGRTFFSKDYKGENIGTRILEPASYEGGGFSPEAGILSEDNKKIGTYIHGLFGNEIFKDFVVELINKNIHSRGLKLKPGTVIRSYETVKNDSFNLLSENIERHINTKLLRKIIGI